VPLSGRRREQLRREWHFTFRLPPGVLNEGRYVAQALKGLWRGFGIRCTAIKDGAPKVET
jgi:hypothetical protein